MRKVRAIEGRAIASLSGYTADGAPFVRKAQLEIAPGGAPSLAVDFDNTMVTTVGVFDAGAKTLTFPGMPKWSLEEKKAVAGQLF